MMDASTIKAFMLNRLRTLSPRFLVSIGVSLLGLVVFAGGDRLFMVLAIVIGCGLAFGVLMLSSLPFADRVLRLTSKIAPSALTEQIQSLKTGEPLKLYRRMSNMVNVEDETKEVSF